MRSTCEGLGPTKKPKAELGLLELGVHLSYRPGDVVTLCGSGLLHEVGDWLGRRESLRVPLHEGQCA